MRKTNYQILSSYAERSYVYDLIPFTVSEMQSHEHSNYRQDPASKIIKHLRQRGKFYGKRLPVHKLCAGMKLVLV